MNSTQFNFGRFGQILWIDIRVTYGYIGLSFIIPLSILMLQTHTVGFIDTETVTLIFNAYLWIAGLIFTSYAFADLHKKTDRFVWMMLPASTFEKFLSRLLYSSLFFWLWILIGFILIQLLLLLTTWSPIESSFFAPFQALTESEFYLTYLLWHGALLLGSASFKKWVVIKTFSLIALIYLFIAMLILLLVALEWVNLQDFFSLQPNSSFEQEPLIGWQIIEEEPFFYVMKETYQIGLEAFLWCCIPLFWGVTFLKIKNTEVKNGI